MASKSAPKRYLGILLIAILVACGTLPPEQAGKVTPTRMPADGSLAAPSAPVSTSSPTTGEEPPPCTFPLAQTTSVNPAPVEYVFAEPQAVQANLSSILQIISWLPDNQRVLITQTYQNQPYQSIDVFDPETGEIQTYARRTTLQGDPVWMSAINAVVYPFTELVNPNPNDPNAFRPPYHLKRQLWLSTGDPTKAKMLENADLTLNATSVFSVVAKPEGNEIMYLANTGEYPTLRKVTNASLGKAQSVAFDPRRWAFHDKAASSTPSYKLLWRPESTQVLLYTDVDNVAQTHYTFLLDVGSGQICEVNLRDQTAAGNLAVNLLPRWSPNGHYLAVISTNGFVVLDAATGQLYAIRRDNVISPSMQGDFWINDVAWAPDSRHLIAAVQVADSSVPPGEEYLKLQSLYLVDLLSGRAAQIQSNVNIGTHFGHIGVLWSTDGRRLLAKCSAPSGLCLLEVYRAIHR